MSLKETHQYKQLKEAMELIHKLKIPEHLQEKALAHLLQGSHEKHEDAGRSGSSFGQQDDVATTGNLREFINEYNPKGAVAEIPALLYWLKTKEKKVAANEADVLEIYRRANIRPPKNIAQSFRDLASKKYGRLEAVKDKPGYVRLSRVGEDFVLYDLKPKK